MPEQYSQRGIAEFYCPFSLVQLLQFYGKTNQIITDADFPQRGNRIQETYSEKNTGSGKYISAIYSYQFREVLGGPPCG